jgi:hypothetical protein
MVRLIILSTAVALHAVFGAMLLSASIALNPWYAFNILNEALPILAK